MRIRDLLTRDGLELTPAETRIAQVLLTDYPIAGLGTATALARRAGVSDPTVVRLAAKLGFDGFASFQAKLLGEIESGLQSPLMMMETKRPAAQGRGVAQAYIRSVAEGIGATADMVVPQAYERAVQLIMDTKGRVLLLGGRFSRFVAGMLASYLSQFRPNVVSIGALSSASFDLLLDVDARDTLVVLDHRRYQTDVIRFSEQAVERGAQLVLLTDTFRSPLSAKAKVSLIARLEAGSPYDSLAPAVAQIEALVAHIVASDSRGRRARVQELEHIRARNAVTIESSGEQDGRSRKGDCRKSAADTPR
jgi:DNA-binding MurR/RpiR family transcriptional regulator